MEQPSKVILSLTTLSLEVVVCWYLWAGVKAIENIPTYSSNKVRGGTDAIDV